MDAERTAQQTIAQSRQDRGDSRYAPGLLLGWTDVYHEDATTAPLRITHLWSDSMVNVAMALCDEDGEVVGHATRQMTAESLLAYAEAILEIIPMRDRGTVADA